MQVTRKHVLHAADKQSCGTVLNVAGCSEIYLFGSIAKGRYGIDSDIDIAVKSLSKSIGKVIFLLHLGGGE
jgi:predicted nucleotidyltransferase